MATETLPLSELLSNSLPFASYLPSNLELDRSGPAINQLKFKNYSYQFDGRDEIEVHRLDLVFDAASNPFTIKIPGLDGFEIRLGPDQSTSGNTVIPFVLSHQWSIRKFFGGIDLESFDFSVQGFINIVKRTFDLEESQILWSGVLAYEELTKRGETDNFAKDFYERVHVDLGTYSLKLINRLSSWCLR